MQLKLTYKGWTYVADGPSVLADPMLAGGSDPWLSGVDPDLLPTAAPRAEEPRASAATPAHHLQASSTATPQVAPAPTPGLHLTFAGFNYVADVDGSYSANSLPTMIAETNSNAVALTEDYGIDAATSTVYADYSHGSHNGYTETLNALATTIQSAESDGLSVMVRPLIDFFKDASTAERTSSDGTTYSPLQWRASYLPEDPDAFFKSYDSIVVAQASIAAENHAQIFDIGTELDQLTGDGDNGGTDYLPYWQSLIQQVKGVFSGPLTYSSIGSDDESNWIYQGGDAIAGDGNLETQISFWGSLDYVGIDEYTVISDDPNLENQQYVEDNQAAVLQELVDGWTEAPTDEGASGQTGGLSLVQYYTDVANDLGKPLLFTELGYNSAPDAATQPFYTSDTLATDYDPLLQQLLYEAFFDAWETAGDSTLKGVYLWNWEPDPTTVGAGSSPNWTPQDNTGALQVVATGYGEGLAACFAHGTRIAVPEGAGPKGAVPIEALRIGDMVMTAAGTAKPVKWIGRRSYGAKFARGNAGILPVLIHAGALANGIPSRDLRVSPKHAMMIAGVLVPADLLVNGRSILQPDVEEDVHYLHVELGRHDVLVAEGAPSESFVDCDSRALFHNADEFARLYPDDHSPTHAFCAERVEAGEALAVIRRRLAHRAGLFAEHADDATLEGPLDGRIDTAADGEVTGWAFDATRPRTPVRIQLLDRGRVLAELTANGYRPDLAGAGKGAGTCAFRIALPSLSPEAVLTVRRVSDGATLPDGPRAVALAAA